MCVSRRRQPAATDGGGGGGWVRVGRRMLPPRAGGSNVLISDGLSYAHTDGGWGLRLRFFHCAMHGVCGGLMWRYRGRRCSHQRKLKCELVSSLPSCPHCHILTPTKTYCGVRFNIYEYHYCIWIISSHVYTPYIHPNFEYSG